MNANAFTPDWVWEWFERLPLWEKNVSITFEHSNHQDLNKQKWNVFSPITSFNYKEKYFINFRASVLFQWSLYRAVKNNREKFNFFNVQVYMSSNIVSPECIRKCLVRAFLREKHFLHIEHLNSFSPVCKRKCVVRVPLSEKHFSHFEHSNGFFTSMFAKTFCKIAFLRKAIFTFWTFKWFFTSMCTRMSSQNTSIRKIFSTF